jgi:hypothetical protein
MILKVKFAYVPNILTKEHLYFRQVVLSANYLFGKTSVRQNVRSAKRPSTKCPFGKMSFGKMSVRQNVRSAKRPLAKCPFGKMSFGKMSFGKVSFGKMSGYPNIIS